MCSNPIFFGDSLFFISLPVEITTKSQYVVWCHPYSFNDLIFCIFSRILSSLKLCASFGFISLQKLQLKIGNYALSLHYHLCVFFYISLLMFLFVLTPPFFLPLCVVCLFFLFSNGSGDGIFFVMILFENSCKTFCESFLWLVYFGEVK